VLGDNFKISAVCRSWRINVHEIKQTPGCHHLYDPKEYWQFTIPTFNAGDGFDAYTGDKRRLVKKAGINEKVKKTYYALGNTIIRES